MKVEVQTPAKQLNSFVKCYTIIETPTPLETVVLPHCGLVLAIQFKGDVKIDRNTNWENVPTMTLSGMRKSFRKFNYSKDTSTILVTFTAIGAASIFKQPIFELFENYQSVNDLFTNSAVKLLEEQIANAKDNQQRIKLVDSFLISKLMKPEPDKLIISAIHQIHSYSGQNSIRSLANNFDLSEDAFEKRFRKTVGASPKQFSTIVRMKTLVAKRNQTKLLTNLAFDFDFYDQSHLIKQFKRFTGQSPKDFFKTPYVW